MHCFHHESVDAVGICKHCYRGLCGQCAVLIQNSLSCQGKCEAEVAAYADLMDRSKTIYPGLGNLYRSGGIFFTVVGAAALVAGLFAEPPSLRPTLVGLGATLLLLGLYMWWWAGRYAKEPPAE